MTNVTTLLSGEFDMLSEIPTSGRIALINERELGMRRSDTTKKKHFRSPERLFQGHERQWYFQSREGARGPFNRRELAQLELERFVDTMQYVEQNRRLLPSEFDLGDVTMVDLDQPNCYSG